MGGIHMMQAALMAMAQAIEAAPRFELPNLLVSERNRAPWHRHGGARAHRNWKRRRASGRS
jgi:hypothetical protein